MKASSVRDRHVAFGRLARQPLDASFFGRLLLTGMGNAFGRALGLVIATSLAGLFGPGEYGYIRWAISVAMLAAIPASAGPVAIARALGAARDDPDRQGRLATIGLVATTAVAAACGIAVAITLAALGRPAAGVIAVLIGVSVYNAWFGICRGTGNARSMAALYVGNNALQLVLVVVLCGWLGILVPDLVLVFYGFAWLPMLLVVSRRILNQVKLADVPEHLHELWRVWGAQVLAQGAYAAWTWGDIVVVEHVLGATAAGYYGLARTGATVFLLVPEAVAILLLPKVAAEGRRAMALTTYLLGLTGGISALLVLGTLVFLQPLLGMFRNGQYAPAAVVMPGLAVGMAIYTLYMVLEGYTLGLGRPRAPVLGMCATATATLISALILLPTQGLAGAGLAFAIGAAVGLTTLVLASWRPWLKRLPEPLIVTPS